MHLFQDKRLIIVTGKGGVGKSSFAAALGLLASQNKNALLVSLRDDDSLAEIFGFGDLEHKPRVIQPGLKLINIEPKEVLKEYALDKIKLESVYRLIFDNRVVRFFLEATPGLDEFLCLIKIHALAKNKNGKSAVYDTLIVDAPATGHGVSLLKIAQTVAAIARVGPIAAKAKEIDALLKEEDTALVVLTLLEELPVTETLELCQRIEAETELAVYCVVANKLFPSLPVEAETLEKIKASLTEKNAEGAIALFDRLKKIEAISGSQKNYFEKLKRSVDISILSVPYFLTKPSHEEVPFALANYLEKSTF